MFKVRFNHSHSSQKQKVSLFQKQRNEISKQKNMHFIDRNRERKGVNKR